MLFVFKYKSLPIGLNIAGFQDLIPDFATLSRKNGMGDKVAAFQAECMSGDFQHLLATCMEWFDCD